MLPGVAMRRFSMVLSLSALLMAGSGCAEQRNVESEVETEVTSAEKPAEALSGPDDDRLELKSVMFDPEVVDGRPYGFWSMNQSGAIVGLDVPAADPRVLEQQSLYPSYQSALNSVVSGVWLPSVNLIGGRAKQFDDGLIAALDLALLGHSEGAAAGHLLLLQRLLARAEAGSAAVPFLSAALTLGGVRNEFSDSEATREWIRSFESDLAVATPIGVYTWSDDLKRCWRCLRFLQQPLDPGIPQQRATLQSLCGLLSADGQLRADYMRGLRLQQQLCSAQAQLSLDQVIGVDLTSAETLAALQKQQAAYVPGVSFFPASRSRESELFSRLFPDGVPADANLMELLMSSIRSNPRGTGPDRPWGWFDHQVQALQYLLLPETAGEHNKLLLTRTYRRRMQEAFTALLTKRRETHVRQLDVAHVDSSVPLESEQRFRPRLRLEPCVSWYLRTARGYQVLLRVLLDELGAEELDKVHRLTPNGAVSESLAVELGVQERLFYGLYLLSCEDIGFRPQLLDGEVADMAECQRLASGWLESLYAGKETTEDTRVAVPIFIDRNTGSMRLWAVLGVRLAPLQARFETPPSIRLMNSSEDWQQVPGDQLESANWTIAVDEFLEVEVPALVPPTREQFRRLCDQFRTKAEIRKALQGGTWQL